ncbi:c-type cytochrome [Telmatospirillum sp. J64-1]|uniref:c-type cytochrome n=1 Tax=Telmatospirillum sp. J64-1 TaxID=2502183 RepID=UPI00115EECB1|nr:c-type cytochrome [Telmatospirillum sp. J64-1]
MHVIRTSLILLLAAALHPAAAQPVTPDPENGHRLASGGNERAGPCFTCHGLHGEGDDANGAPRLAGLSAYYIYKQMKNFTEDTRHNDIMTPIAEEMSLQEWWDVGAFYEGLDTPLPPPPEPNEADMAMLQRGEEIALHGLPQSGVPACAACHGRQGEGAMNSVPYLAGQGRNYMELQFRHWLEGERSNDPVGGMQHIARLLSPEDVRAVSAWFARQRPE